MQKTIIGILVSMMVLGIGNAFAGNGAPNGAHYNLNIIGVPKDKTADMDGSNGHVIFVPLYGKAKIILTESDNFNQMQVLDANGTDRDGATFALPNPDPDRDGTTDYSVYIRALGKPYGEAVMQSCYTEYDGDEWCADDFLGGVEPITVQRRKGKSTFRNVSKDLLYVDFCVEWVETTVGVWECMDVDQVPLFSEDVEEYFWEYDNKGLKLAQLRFYEVPTDTGWTDTDGEPDTQ